MTIFSALNYLVCNNKAAVRVQHYEHPVIQLQSASILATEFYGRFYEKVSFPIRTLELVWKLHDGSYLRSQLLTC